MTARPHFPLLRLSQVGKTFGSGARAVHAVTDVSLDLQPGIVGLLGHNGAGKSTLMQMIATLSRPSSGRILYRGEDLAQRPDRLRQRLGYLPQDFGVFPHLSVLEFMQYFAALKGVADPGRIRRLLEQVNLHGQAHQPAARLSGGMRQRLGIAQALLNDPEVLIVDEPSAGLDPEERLRLRQLLSEIGLHALVIVSTHIVPDIENLASQLAVMREGRLVAFESPERLIARSRGQVWSATVAPAHYERLRATGQVLHAQRQGDCIDVRVAGPAAPAADARQVEPTLEEALMAQRHAAPALAAAT